MMIAGSKKTESGAGFVSHVIGSMLIVTIGMFQAARVNGVQSFRRNNRSILVLPLSLAFYVDI